MQDHSSVLILRLLLAARGFNCRNGAVGAGREAGRRHNTSWCCWCAAAGRFQRSPTRVLVGSPMNPGPPRWQLTREGAAEGAEGLLLCGSRPDAVTKWVFLTMRKLCKSSPECQPAPAAWKGSALASVLFLPTGEKSLSYFFMPKRGTGNRLKGTGWMGAPEAYSLGGGRARLRLPSLRPFPATSVLN